LSGSCLYRRASGVIIFKASASRNWLDGEKRHKLEPKANVEDYLRARRIRPAIRIVPIAAAPPAKAMPIYPSLATFLSIKVDKL